MSTLVQSKPGGNKRSPEVKSDAQNTVRVRTLGKPSLMFYFIPALN